VHSGGPLYRFGPFELDASQKRLRHGDRRVAVPRRHLEVLRLLADRTGQLVSKDALIEAGWPDLAVTDSSIAQAIRGLRARLGAQPDGTPYIETLSRQGYRFLAPVERGQPRSAPVALDSLLAPYRAFVEGRAALERLDRNAITRARTAFEDGLRAVPDDPAAHIGLANACVFAFESTRADLAPDLTALQQADHHATQGCQLDPSSGDAWSTLAFVRHRLGRTNEAMAAGRKAVTLEPHNWHHYVRLAFVSWGEERRRAAHRALTLCPGLALAHWFSASVFVARQAFDAALTELRAGVALQDAQRLESGRFRAVGLHLLHGLVLGARGDVPGALDELMREIASEADGHVYARECAANAWYACGALHLREGRHDAAASAFQEALTRVPGHALAMVGLTAIDSSADLAATAQLQRLAGQRRPAGQTRPVREDAPAGQAREAVHIRPDVTAVDAAIAQAVSLASQGRHDEAARICGNALAHADPGATGWLLPAEPLLRVTARRDVWAQVLALVRERAS
jgi:DNA-binding winged helix-turn-helix (wHTH) protein